MKLIFKYANELIPPELYYLTTSQIGNSRIDKSPIYDIEFNITQKLFDSVLQNSNPTIDNDEYFSNIRLFLRKEKTKKILNDIKNKEYVIDKEHEKFVQFIQFYYDKFDNLNIIQSINKDNF